jgi:hypothetical protein
LADIGLFPEQVFTSSLNLSATSKWRSHPGQMACLINTPLKNAAKINNTAMKTSTLLSKLTEFVSFFNIF